MATDNNTIKTRIQMKSDTEANWTAHPIVPLNGEIIIYSTDQTHSYARMKIGDGATSVVNLPFIDAGTLNGEADFINKYASYNNFPAPGSTKSLYLDTSTGQMYHYDGMTGYQPIATVSVNATSTQITEVVQWRSGRATTASMQDNVLVIQNGSAPQLLTQNTTVLTGIQVGGNN